MSSSTTDTPPLATMSSERITSRPQSWNALRALECLTPPSPSPSGSLGALATLASLGDIPIFLHTSDDAPPHDLNLVCPSPGRPHSAYLMPSGSTTTVHSTNTFGMPRSQTPDMPFESQNVLTHDDASDRTARPSTARPTNPPDSAYLSTVRPSRSAGYFSNRLASISDLSRFTVSAYMDPWRSNDNLAASSSSSFYSYADSGPAISPSGSIIVTQADDSSSFPQSPPAFYEGSPCPSTDSLAGGFAHRLAPSISRSWSNISSAIFTRRNLSPSPSTTSTTASEEQISGGKNFRFPRKPSGKSSSPSSHSDLGTQTTRCPSPLGKHSSISTPASPITSRSEAMPRPLRAPGLSIDAESGAPRFPSNSAPGASAGTHSPSSHPRPISRPAPVHSLPGVLSWMRGIRIELWIDQEGFRAIRPQFHLTGYTPPSTEHSHALPSITDTLTHGIAIFQPTRRQGAIYHRGALDSAPVLRRLTLAGNEEKDYISRHASLTIKADGVYAVTGTEWFADFPRELAGERPDGTGSLLLKWRFEYRVDDCVPGPKRPVVSGDKAFIPLSFSCSPGLLHPAHGKPIRLMHVLKKNITPKLSAKRARANASRPSKSPQQDVAPTAHRRTRSSDPSVSLPTTLSDRTRKTRSASVSEPEARSRTTTRTDASTVVSPRLSAHIISPEELAQILENFPTPANTAVVARTSWGLSPPSYMRRPKARWEVEGGARTTAMTAPTEF
ncbi:hypothetical protein BN946_scf185007.g233 [Trametes cinnabarina]|uniref:Uncharacterized protein n=1 Tax=Pycnoporus cinnabarinus TaxID=5643 RepID=A0A060SL63_PYCCI|nr:hypothetical protein BN946_scf185007.g233 [Trametes cinnabarina]